MGLAYWNGNFEELSQLKIPAWDRSVFFGDAVYEVIRIYQGQLWLPGEHYDRLDRSLESIGIKADLLQIKKWNQQLIEKSRIVEGTLYFQISRGEGGRSHAPEAQLTPNAMGFVKELSGDPFETQRSVGAKVMLIKDTRWGRCDIKSTNLLANVLAQKSAKDNGYDESVFYNERGFITEGSHSSLLMIRNQTVYSPPNGPHLLPGITRNFAQKLCQEIETSFKEEWFTSETLQQADEIFLAGTTMEILPVTYVNSNPVGSGKPGPLSLTLQQLYRGRIKNEK